MPEFFADWSTYQLAVVFLLFLIGLGVSRAINLLKDVEYSTRHARDLIEDKVNPPPLNPYEG